MGNRRTIKAPRNRATASSSRIPGRERDGSSGFESHPDRENLSSTEELVSLFLKIIESSHKRYETLLAKYKDKSISYNKIKIAIFNGKIIKLLEALIKIDGKLGKSYIATIDLDKNITAMLTMKVLEKGIANFYPTIGLKEDIKILSDAMKGKND